MKSLSDIAINNYYRGVKKFAKCYSKDKLPKLENKCYIINMEDSNKGSGSHWVAILNCNPKETVYFDSFGETHAPIEIEQFMKASKKKIVRNKIDLQNIMSESCGEFCIYFINHAIKGQTFAKILTHFTFNSVINEHILKEYFGKESFTEKTLKASIMKHKLNGKGIKDMIKYVKNKIAYVKNAFSGKHRLNFAPKVRKILAEYGNTKIDAIRLCRQPINSVLHKVLNWASLGTFESNLKSLNYDNAFHLYLLFHLQNGTVIKVEKNAVIDAIVSTWNQQPHTEHLEVASPGNTLNQFLENGLKLVGEEKYFVYDSKTQNCQYFVQANLQANGVLNNELNTFAMQDAEAIYKNLGYLEKANKVITDIASKSNNAYEGAGLRRKI